ncbi:GNAT family N-acetyltransferase [Streptococcus dentasini]
MNRYSLGYTLDQEQTEQQLKKLLKDSHHFLLGFEDEVRQELVAYVHAEVYDTLYSETGFNVLGLAVLLAYQNQGIGKELMQGLEAEARKRQYAFIRLNSSANRKDAHAFYDTIG